LLSSRCLSVFGPSASSLESLSNEGVYIAARAASADGLLCCTISNDRSVKIYDVVNYDMMVMIGLSLIPVSFSTCKVKYSHPYLFILKTTNKSTYYPRTFYLSYSFQ
jgi:hypothetical protein